MRARPRADPGVMGMAGPTHPPLRAGRGALERYLKRRTPQPHAATRIPLDSNHLLRGSTGRLLNIHVGAANCNSLLGVLMVCGGQMVHKWEHMLHF